MLRVWIVPLWMEDGSGMFRAIWRPAWVVKTETEVRSEGVVLRRGILLLSLLFGDWGVWVQRASLRIGWMEMELWERLWRLV